MLERAVAALSSVLPGRMHASTPVESEPWGYKSENRFLNIGVMIDMTVDLAPAELIERVMAVERSISQAPHRDATGGYCDRLIDIDVIAVDNLVIETPALTLPHPRMHLRQFVLIPLQELDPDWTHPIFHKTSSQLLKDLKEVR